MYGDGDGHGGRVVTKLGRGNGALSKCKLLHPLRLCLLCMTVRRHIRARQGRAGPGWGDQGAGRSGLRREREACLPAVAPRMETDMHVCTRYVYITICIYNNKKKTIWKVLS